MPQVAEHKFVAVSPTKLMNKDHSMHILNNNYSLLNYLQPAKWENGGLLPEGLNLRNSPPCFCPETFEAASGFLYSHDYRKAAALMNHRKRAEKKEAGDETLFSAF